MSILLRVCSAISIALVAIGVRLATSDGRHLLDPLNRFVFPRGRSVVVAGEEHVAWRNETRRAADEIRAELRAWEEDSGNSLPEFTSIVPAQYFPEADAATRGREQVRSWGFLWLRLYGADTRLAAEFPGLMGLYDSLDVEIYSVGISVLHPGRGDVTHFGEFRGTWRQLLTIEEPRRGTVRLGLYPYAAGGGSANGEGEGGEFARLCDSIWTPPEVFQERCQTRMESPLIHEYREGKDILFDDSVWHFIDNDATEGRRVAIWADVVRTDLNLWQRIFLRTFMFLATNLNDEVVETVRLVNELDYKTVGAKASGDWALEDDDDGSQRPMNNAPKGPIEDYDRTNIIDVDVGFD